MSLLRKLNLYSQACQALGRLDWRSFPLWPKAFSKAIPYNRTAYCEFLLVLQKLGLENPCWIIDAGAHHGVFAQAASTFFPQASLLLIEPLPFLLQELQSRSNFFQNRWIIESTALGAQPGQATLYGDPTQPAASSLEPASPAYQKQNPTYQETKLASCQVRTLDDLAQHYGIHHLDLLKIDVEGSEKDVLQGSSHLLTSTQALFLEISPLRHPHFNNQETLTALLEKISSLGFTLLELTPTWFHRDIPWLPCEYHLLARRRST